MSEDNSKIELSGVTIEDGKVAMTEYLSIDLDNETWWRALQNRHGVGERLGKN